MVSSKFKLLTTVCATATLLSFASQAVAQSSSSTEAEVDEIIVVGVAEKFGSGLTQATFTIGAEDIEDRPFGAEITQSLNQIPGVQVSTGDSRGGVFSYEIYLRGLTDEQIGFSVDGVPTGDSRTQGGGPANRFLDSSNVGRIVVSQSSGEIGSPTRFGLGGFMNFETSNPSSEQGFTFEASAGSFDHRRLFARADFGELLPGFTGYVSYSDSDTDVWAGGDRSNKRQHAALKLVKETERGHRFAFNANWNDLQYNDFNIITQPLFLANPRSDGAVGNFRGIPSLDQINSLQPYGPAFGGFREDLLVYLNADFQLSDALTFEVNPYWHKGEGESNSLQDRARTIAGGDPRGLIGYDPADNSAIRPAVTATPSADRSNFGEPTDLRITPRDRDRYGATAELAYENQNTDSPFAGLRGGVWFESSKANEDRNFFPLTDPASSIQIDRNNLTYVDYERNAKVTTTMLYGQAQFSLLNERLNVDAGLTWLDTGYKASSPLEYQGEVDISRDSGLLPKIGANFQLTDSVEIFGAYAQNWSGIPEDTFLGSTAAITSDLEGIESENADIGIRFVGDNSAFSIQGYVIDADGFIGFTPLDALVDPVEVVTGNAATKSENLGSQKTEGIEVTGFHDFGALDIYASYAYQNAKHGEAANAAEALALREVGVIAGERVRDIPKSSLFGKVGWDANDNLRLEANVNHTGKRVGAHLITPGFCNPFFCFGNGGPAAGGVEAWSPLGLDELPSHTTVGVLAQYEVDVFNGLTLQMNIDNVFDEEYISSVSGATATLPEFGAAGNFGGEDITARSGSLDRYFIGAPRTVTFSVKGKF